MKINAFVSSLAERVNLISKEVPSEINPYVRLENQLTFIEFQALLDSLKDNDATVTKASLAPIANWLKNRGQRIHRTDALPCHAPRLPANLLCREVMRELQPYFQDEVYQLIFPRLKAVKSDISLRHLSQLQFHEYVLTDDGCYFIEIATCLNRLEKTKVMQVTCSEDGARRELSDSEKDRILKHGHLTADFYKLCCELQIKKELRSVKLMLRDELRLEDYQVGATYGREENAARLKERLFSGSITPFQNLNELVNYLVNLPRSKWQVLLMSFNRVALTTLLLDGRPLDEVIKSGDIYTGEHEQDCAIKACLLMVYLKERCMSGDYTGLFRGYTGYSLANRMECGYAYLQFLISGKPMTDMENYMKETGRGHLLPGMKADTLGKIIDSKKPEPAQYHGILSWVIG